MKNVLIIILGLLVMANPLRSQSVISDEMMKFYTLEWKGERTEDGRPKVSDELLKRLKNNSIEEAWGVLRGEGFNNQFERGWKMLHEDEAFVGRALTAQYIPLRPDVNKRILDEGHKNGRIGASNSWPIDMLQNGDVYVADCFGKVIDGTLIG
ncbi:MAG: RraA family protein, partial [Cyclobacteriaceae bacterium]|nr:RraA family protein [Cyclobacteriaceae bacterium]